MNPLTALSQLEKSFAESSKIYVFPSKRLCTQIFQIGLFPALCETEGSFSYKVREKKRSFFIFFI